MEGSERRVTQVGRSGWYSIFHMSFFNTPGYSVPSEEKPKRSKSVSRMIPRVESKEKEVTNK
jgi:hypothetical protein